MIAVHALAMDATLVTGNIREFGRVEGLSRMGLATEAWLKPRA